MCSTFKFGSCMGRNYDYEQSFNEEVRYIAREEFDNQYNVIGVCTGLVKDYPLMYDGMNEKGLCCSALAFTGNAVYHEKSIDKVFSFAPYEMVFRVLGNFRSVEGIKSVIDKMEITDEYYSDDFPNSDLHWFVADREQSIIIEQTKFGLNWYDGEVMTNNPPYDYQKVVYECDKEMIGKCEFYLHEFETRGKNTYDLKGDYTSEGRFSRLSWLKEQLEKTENSFNPVAQAFHLCSSVEQIYGATPVEDKFEYTIYSVVYDMENKEVYLKFYDDLETSVFKL